MKKLKVILYLLLVLSFYSCEDEFKEKSVCCGAIEEVEVMNYTLLLASYEYSKDSLSSTSSKRTSDEIIANLDWLAFNCCNEHKDSGEYQSKFRETNKRIIEELNRNGNSIIDFMEILDCSECSEVRSYLRKKKEQFLIIQLLS